MAESGAVLVTGGSGLVGANVVRALLERGYRVRCLVRSAGMPLALADLDVETVRGDVRDRESVARALRGCGLLIHAAASYRLSAREAREVFETNVLGTRVVMEEAIKAEVGRVVYTSSVAAIGAVAGRSATEGDEPSLAVLPGPYERSKWVAERLVRGLVDREGLPAVIVNPCTVVGAWDVRPTRTGQLIIDTVRGRMPAYVHTGMNVVTAQDVGSGHVLALERGRIGSRYILGRENLSLAGLLERIDRLAGRQRRRVRMPHLAALGAAVVDEFAWSRLRGREPRVPLAGVRLARSLMYYDSRRAIEELGLPQTPIDEGLRAAIEWFRRFGRL